jgi:hypothetical protein
VQSQARGITGIPSGSKQLFNTLASHLGYDPELGHVSADGIDHRGLLADQSWRVRWSIIKRTLCPSALSSRDQ